MLADERSFFGARRFILLYSFLYLLAFFPLLIKSSRFWEDWYLLRDGIVEQFTSLGFFWEPFYQLGLNATGAAAWLSGLSAFLFFYASGLVLYLLLRRLPFLSPGERFVIALFTILAPINFARVTQTVSARGIQYLLLMLGALLFLRHAERPRLWLRLSALLCFLPPLMVDSVAPVFLALLVGFCACRAGLDWTRPRLGQLINNGLRHLDFVALPFILVFGRQALFYGDAVADAEGRLPFRQITLEGLFDSIVPAISGAFYFLPQQLSLLTITGLARWAACLIVVAAAVWLLSRRDGLVAAGEDRLFSRPTATAGVRAGAAFLLLVLSLYPYFVVDKSINFVDWQTRSHFSAQIVIGLFAAFLLQFLLKPRLLGAALVLLASHFVAVNSHIYLEYVADGHVQNAFMGRLADSETTRQARTIYVDERQRPERTLGRRYYSHELTNMTVEVYGGRHRLVTSCNHDLMSTCREIAQRSIDAQTEGIYGYDEYASDGTILTPEVHIRMIGDESIGLATTLRLTWLQFTRPERYRETVKSILELEVTPLS